MTRLSKLFSFIAAAFALATASFTDAAIYSEIEMTDINIKNQGEVAHVAPGETFGIRATYEFIKPREIGSIVQIIVGYEGIGAQTCIANGLVARDGHYYDHHPLFFRNQRKDITKQTVNFALSAPQEPGVYEIRFRYAQAYLPEDAVKHWWNVDAAPTESATIGKIIVE